MLNAWVKWWDYICIPTTIDGTGSQNWQVLTYKEMWCTFLKSFILKTRSPISEEYGVFACPGVLITCVGQSLADCQLGQSSSDSIQI